MTPDQAPSFYPNRVRLLQDWLAENPDRFSPAQADYPDGPVPGPGGPSPWHYRLPTL